MSERRYTIRTMEPSELALALDWAAAEGWNPGRHDAESFYAADPEGFLLGLLEDEPVAAISVVRYGASFGFLGLYLVKPGYRGQGLGWAIWQAGMARLAGRTVGLDGVVAQQANYRKSGFVWAYANVRYQGLGGGSVANLDVQPLSTFAWPELCDYDRAMFSVERTTFLQHWITQPESTALGIQENGRLAGYGVLRACRAGFKIGPLFADRADIAERLFTALRAHASEGADIYLDVPSVNGAAVELARRHGMRPVFETARMYAGEPPQIPLEKVFGVTSFELG